jgi:hypothetical protein
MVHGDERITGERELSRALGHACLHWPAPSPTAVEARERLRVNGATQLAESR